MAKADLDTELGEIVTKYLKAKGWNAVVVCADRVQQYPDGMKYNFEFVIKFIGSKSKKQR